MRRQAQLEALESGIGQGLRCRARDSRFPSRPFTQIRKEASRLPEKNPADRFLIAPLSSRLRLTAGAMLIAHSGRDKPTPTAVTGDLDRNSIYRDWSARRDLPTGVPMFAHATRRPSSRPHFPAPRRAPLVCPSENRCGRGNRRERSWGRLSRRRGISRYGHRTR